MNLSEKLRALADNIGQGMIYARLDAVQLRALAAEAEALERNAELGKLALRWHQSPADIAESRAIDLHAACGRILRSAKEQP